MFRFDTDYISSVRQKEGEECIYIENNISD